MSQLVSGMDCLVPRRSEQGSTTCDALALIESCPRLSEPFLSLRPLSRRPAFGYEAVKLSVDGSMCAVTQERGLVSKREDQSKSQANMWRQNGLCCLHALGGVRLLKASRNVDIVEGSSKLIYRWTTRCDGCACRLRRIRVTICVALKRGEPRTHWRLSCNTAR